MLCRAKCTDEEKLEKFKFMARMREMSPTVSCNVVMPMPMPTMDHVNRAAWLQVKSSMDMLGGESPVIIGKRLNTKFFQGTSRSCLLHESWLTCFARF